MEINDSVRSFLSQDKVQKLLVEGKFEAVYRAARRTLPSPAEVNTLTQIFYESGLNPLQNSTMIPQGFLAGNETLTTFTVPSHISKIDAQAFTYSKLEEIHLPATVTQIGVRAFEGCRNLKAVYIESLLDWFNIDFKDYYAVPLAPHRNCGLYIQGQLLTDLVTPEGVTKLQEDVFVNYATLKTAIISEGVVTIADWAFYNDSRLAQVSLPSTLTFIGRGAFSDCTDLTDISYSGTREQWKAIDKHRNWKTDSSIKAIHCTDGVIKYK